MENYFDSEIKRARQEMVDLKTSQQKFAGEIPLAQQSTAISIPLGLSSGGFTAEGHAMVKITTEESAMFVATLDSYYDDVTLSSTVEQETRRVYFQIGRIAENQYLLRFTAIGTNWGDNNDVYRIKQGESVSVPRTLTVQCTDNFTLEVL